VAKNSQEVKMKGDFSRWNFDKNNNFNGVLHQQGRVLTDNDWNAGTRMLNAWQEQNGRDVIGPGVAAVPAEVPDSYKVQGAEFISNQVKLKINPGRVWADGLLTYLPGEGNDPTAPVKRTATYLEPPFQAASINESSIGTDVRDAVILEIWQEAVNGFQVPGELLEPALGGPDTTERVHTSMAFRLLRLEAGETCADAADRLKEDLSDKGALIVTLAPPETIGGECPVEEGGGYTGFEHYLYRIEMAKLDDAVQTANGPMFKWSRFNGGLVGRGEFSTSPAKVKITDNFQAITTCGLTSFYLEAVQYDENLGHWQVTCGAEVTLNADNELDLVGTTYYGSIPTSGGTVFFRLWDGIKPISPSPDDLENGISLEFELDPGKHYIPGDYWTFEVRAGGIKNNELLIGSKDGGGVVKGDLPHGIRYHRVPLAILNWKPNEGIVSISDCRRIFRPLIDQEGCCTFIVGKSGHFASIQTAINHLPDSGGQICILPGIYIENITIENKKNIVITGCDKRSVIMPADQEGKPVFHIRDSQCITLEHMDMEAFGGTGVLMQATQTGQLKEIEVSHNRILACVNAVRVEDGEKIKIVNNTIRMLDKEGGDVAIFIQVEEGLIQGNDITVVPADEMPPGDNIPGDRPVPGFTDPCADLKFFVNFRPFLFNYFTYIWDFVLKLYPVKQFKTPGGIQIVGGSEKIKVLENEIIGGAGNGITFGGKIEPVSPGSEEGEEEIEHVITHPGGEISGTVALEGSFLTGIELLFRTGSTKFTTETGSSTHFIIRDAPEGDYNVSIMTPGLKIVNITKGADDEFRRLRINVVEEEPRLHDDLPFIYEIQINGNEISNMGLSGIGTAWFVRRKSTISRTGRPSIQNITNHVVGLRIHQNHIFNCLQNPNHLEENFDISLNPKELEKQGETIGFGGISLDFCQDVSIFGNRIENNGISHIHPVCGIYIINGEYVDISHNQVVNNGPILENTGTDLKRGMRKGIFIRASSLIGGGLFDHFEFPIGKLAARVHDNVVDQPAGGALFIEAFGSLSILNNRFDSELSGSKISAAEGISVVYVNHRGSLIRNNPDRGHILFCNNQTRVGPDNEYRYSQYIRSSDGDIGFHDNQSFNLSNREGVAEGNTIIYGETIRASGNRFKEIKEKRKKTSLYTRAKTFNNTVNNQGDNAIIAVSELSPPRVVDVGNQF
jgi:hypothetical protein